MSDDVFDEIKDIFEIDEENFIEFKELYGFTFVFLTKIFLIKDNISTAEIKPLGIIYKENGEYYFVALNRVTNLEEIVKEYIKQI